MIEYANSIIEISCLNGNSVIDAAVSDHYPLIYTSDTGIFCSFNILTRCESLTGNNGSYYNNGFKCVESDEQYQARLSRLVLVIEELVTKYNVDYFLLQEAPPPTIGKAFYKVLQARIPMHIIDADNLYVDSDLGEACSSGGVLIIYPSKVSIENITNSLRNYVSKANQQRYIALQITNNTQSPFCIANFHAKYKYQNSTLTDIEVLLKMKLLVGGDFNLLISPDFAVPKCSAPTLRGMFLQQTYDAILDARKIVI